MSNFIYLKDNYIRSCAWVTQIPHNFHCMFHVLFEDGYENIFFTDIESGLWVEEDLGFTQLAASVGEEIKQLICTPEHVPKLLKWYKILSNNEIIVFGFFCYHNYNHRIYEIYGANKKFMYTLIKLENNEWQIIGNNSNISNDIDIEFAKKVIAILSKYN